MPWTSDEDDWTGRKQDNSEIPKVLIRFNKITKLRPSRGNGAPRNPFGLGEERLTTAETLNFMGNHYFVHDFLPKDPTLETYMFLIRS